MLCNVERDPDEAHLDYACVDCVDTGSDNGEESDERAGELHAGERDGRSSVKL